VDTIGRKPLQIIGFASLTVVFAILGFGYDALSRGALLALYVIANFFFNWGPNTTTFIVPGECFPTRYRSSGHGLSAASGKVGAVVSQVISIPLLTRGAGWLSKLMQIYALFMLCGTFSSLLIPETKGITLEELAGEAPTSYNGSITVQRQRWWHIFSGGHPAGFSYTRATKGYLGGSPRVGIMTSPELAAQSSSSRKGGRRYKNTRGGSQDSAHNEFSSASSTTGMVSPTSVLDGETRGAHGGVFPGWGAGWGRIDRGGNLATENIRLQDVGHLLR
jgi:MFS transporter, PHS family, inorganic phosphate transporter